MGPKIDFWRGFWVVFLGPSFYIDFSSILMVSFKRRPLKNVRPRSVLLTFAVFDFIAKCIEIWSKKAWLLRSKNEKNR